jgi:hypothetical protein
MKKTVIAALAVSGTLAILGLGITSAGTDGGEITPLGDGWEICGRYVCYSFDDQVFYDYAVNVTTDAGTVTFPIFDKVQLSDLQAMNPPINEGGSYLIEGSGGISRAYDIPMGIMSFETNVMNNASFRMTDGMGAIFSDKTAVIGLNEFRGDLILMGSGNLGRNGQDISIPMEPGDKYFFRASYMYEESLGSDIADGNIAGEMYLELDGQSLTSSVIDYQPIDMNVQFSDDDEVEISADASFVEGKTIILTLDESAFDVPLSQMEVELDGKVVQLAGSPKDVISSSEETYFALQNDDSTQVFINIPHFSQRTITISKIGPEEIGMDVYLGATASGLLVVAAAVYLFKRKD